MRNWVIALLTIFALHGAAWAGVQPSKSHKKYAGKVVKKPQPRAQARTKASRPHVAAAPEEQGDHPSLKSTSAFVVDQAGRFSNSWGLPTHDTRRGAQAALTWKVKPEKMLRQMQDFSIVSEGV